MMHIQSSLAGIRPEFEKKESKEAKGAKMSAYAMRFAALLKEKKEQKEEENNG